AIEARRGHVVPGGTGKVLPASPALAPDPDAALAAAHAPQMDDLQLRVVGGERDPIVDPAQVAVDHVPACRPDETTDALEAPDAIELRRADGGLVAGALLDQAAVRTAFEELAREAAETRVRFHPFHHPLEVARCHLEVAVELAHIVEIRQPDLCQAVVEG